MRRKVSIILSVLVIGALCFAVIRPKEAPPEPLAIPAKTEPTNTTSMESISTGSYVPYTPTVIDETPGDKVLFFHAPWCPQCRSIESGIESQGVPDGLTIIKVDYDTNQSLRQKYGVTLQTTFVKIDDDGNFISKFIAYNEPTFDSVKRNFL